jgi:CO/xanthine dehydrogenase Mo-binding subunit
MPESEFSYIGKRGIRRTDAYEKASGSAIYTRDISLPGMLYARFATCPFPYARIRSMDTTEVESYPGIYSVLRYDDPAVEGKILRGSYGASWSVLPRVGRWEGEPVGLVVAGETELICEEALRRARFDWEQLPFVLEEDEALLPNAPLITVPEMADPTNPHRLVERYCFQQGDAALGLKEADRVTEFKLKRRYHTSAGVEMPSAITRWNGEFVELWVHHQHPFEHRQAMAEWFGIPMNRVTIHVSYNGGMFGGWNWMPWSMLMHYIAGVLARRTSRPVKLQLNRRETFYGGSMDAGTYNCEVGFQNDGRIVAVRLKNTFVNSPLGYLPDVGIIHFVDNTSIPNLELENRGVLVNRGPVQAVRCEQLPNTLCLNTVFNRVAGELGMDPTHVALLNDGFEGHGQDYLNTYKREKKLPVRDSLREVIEAGKKAIDWDNKWHLPGTKRLPNGKMHGLGFIWTHEWDSKRGTGFAAILVHDDGTVSLIGQRSDIGLAAETAYRQILADELGVRYEDVVHRPFNDSGFAMMSPDGSCNLTANGWIVKKAAAKAKRKVLELATTPIKPYNSTTTLDAFPGHEPDELDMRDSMVFLKADPSQCVPLKEIVRECRTVQFAMHPPVLVWEWNSLGRPGRWVDQVQLCRQAHFMEVEVDPETGEIDILKVVNVNDVGKAVSPEGVEGQQYGGTYMAIGRSRAEEVILCPTTGVRLNADYLGYKIATYRDCGEVETIIVETGMGYGPYGSVGIGEDVADHMTSMLGPAVYNALGVWVDDYPITPAKVLRALGKA